MTRSLLAGCVLVGLVGGSLCAGDKPVDPKPAGVKNGDAKEPAGKKDAELPEVIKALRAKLTGQAAGEVRGILVKELGAPTRRVGSGELHDQWDIAGGMVSFPPAVYRTKTRTVWLIETKTELGGAIRGGFEMTTAPDAARHGNRFWIGGVQLRADGSYVYATHEANPRERRQQKGNFFIDHPQGKYEVKYREGLNEKSLLEAVGDEDAVVATLSFSAGEAKAEFTIRTDGSSRRLRFVEGAGGALGFCLEKGW